MTKENKKTFLSKSRFIRGLQCHKALWYQTHRPDLIPENPASLQAVFDTGHNVGSLAQQLFPGGVEVPFDGMSLSAQIELTRELIASGTETIFEAAFSHEGIFVKADILHRSANVWRMGEVKSAPKAKDVYLNDVAVQYHVITGCGVPIENAGLVLIDTSYVRNGEIEPEKLFKWVDVTEDVLALQDTVVSEAAKMREMLAGPEPKIDIGLHCTDPYECQFAGHCWAHITYPSVFDFADIGKPDAFALYRQGIVRMEDVPPESLCWRQRLQQECMLNKSCVVDEKAIKEFLETIKYPLSYLDFETLYMMPVPLYDNIRPYQQIPFQYSLHVVNSHGSEPHHIEYLADATAGDPREQFLKSLLDSLSPVGSIIVWNQAFEIGRLNELAAAFPEYEAAIAQVTERVRDLMIPFRNKSVYHGEFDGSYSIKKVLPALVPELSYAGMPVSNGEGAKDAWLSLMGEHDQDRIDTTRRHLLDYCCRDTQAMLRIYQVLASGAYFSVPEL